MRSVKRSDGNLACRRALPTMSPKREMHLTRQGRDKGELFLKGYAPVAAGTGLIALDIVITDRNEQPPRSWAGGTCGNVLTILAYLGWQSYPLMTLGKDAAANRVLQDMKDKGVETEFLRCSESRRTPIIVEKIRTKGPRAPSHRFVWTCPNCGAWFPGYQPLLARTAREWANEIPTPAVFLFDRVSRGGLELAGASAERGALVVFEPSGIGDERLFREAVGLSHVLKYSYERLGHIRELSDLQAPLLEVVTLEGEGLRYRHKGRSRKAPPWKETSAFQVRGFRDSAGAGDWCTAGIIHLLGKEGLRGFKNVGEEGLRHALLLGQALAAVNCRYEGARGGMYSLSKSQFEAAVSKVLSGGTPLSIEKDNTAAFAAGGFFSAVCPGCSAVRQSL